MSEVVKANAENNSRRQINSSGVRKKGEQQTGYYQQLRGDQYVSKRGPAIVLLCRRKHEHSCSCIVFVIEPADGIEVRKLPKKKNGIESPGFDAESVCGRGPAHQNWRGTGECTKECAES